MARFAVAILMTLTASDALAGYAEMVKKRGGMGRETPGEAQKRKLGQEGPGGFRRELMNRARQMSRPNARQRTVQGLDGQAFAVNERVEQGVRVKRGVRVTRRVTTIGSERISLATSSARAIEANRPGTLRQSVTVSAHEAPSAALSEQRAQAALRAAETRRRPSAVRRGHHHRRERR